MQHTYWILWALNKDKVDKMQFFDDYFWDTRCNEKYDLNVHISKKWFNSKHFKLDIFDFLYE